MRLAGGSDGRAPGSSPGNRLHSQPPANGDRVFLSFFIYFAQDSLPAAACKVRLLFTLSHLSWLAHQPLAMKSQLVAVTCTPLPVLPLLV